MFNPRRELIGVLSSFAELSDAGLEALVNLISGLKQTWTGLYTRMLLIAKRGGGLSPIALLASIVGLQGWLRRHAVRKREADLSRGCIVKLLANLLRRLHGSKPHGVDGHVPPAGSFQQPICKCSNRRNFCSS